MATEALSYSRDRILKFTGQFDFVLDNKGRVSIPSRIREVIDLYSMNSLTLRLLNFDHSYFVRVYPTSYYNEEILGKLKDYDGENAFETYEIMRLTANCQQVKIDNQGRLNIPDEILKRLDIKKEIRFVGMGNFFDIWRPDVCDEFTAAQITARKNGSGQERT